MSSKQLTPLGRKIVAAILGTTSIALVLAFVLNLMPMIIQFRQAAVNRTIAQAELMAASLVAAVDFDDASAAQESLETLSFIPDVMGAAVYVDNVTPFAAYGLAPQRVEAEEALSELGVSSVTVAMPIPSDLQGSVLVVTLSLEDQWSIMQGYVLIAFLSCPIILFCCYRVAIHFRRRLGDPLEQMTDTVREISANKDYSRRVDYDSDDELGVLVTEFNSMLSKIQSRDQQLSNHQEMLEETVEERTMQLKRNELELLQNNRLLLSEIKKRAQAEMIREEVERINRHDLKSGLSLVIGYPELLLSEGDLNSRQEKHIKRVRAAGYRMLDMIRNQLNIFKMEKGIYSLSRSSVDLVEIMCGLEEEFRPMLESMGVTIQIHLNGQEVEGSEVFAVPGEGPLLRAMFRNLMQNGIEASCRGDHVSVYFFDDEGKSIVIANSKVVHTDVRRRFFDKYVTHGKENGTGLGTYFAALIARTHGADISMKTQPDMGTFITILFKEHTKHAEIASDLSV
nr:CHASE sensor domain-containing protein [uncultured Pseudodesulfovibrio sp.]